MKKRLGDMVRWEKHKVERRQLMKAHRLRYLFCEVTRRCNYSCAYCGSNCTHSAQNDELNSDRWREILGEIARDFPVEDIMVAFTGGEPLMKPGILDIFDTAGRLGFSFGVVTNGALVDEVAAKRIVESGLKVLSLSMDAPPAVNDRLRGEGASRNVEVAIERMSRAGFEGKFEILTTVTRPVVEHLRAMRCYVASLRIPLWRLGPAMPLGRAAERDDLLVGPEDLRALLDFIKEARTDGRHPVPEYFEEGYLGDAYEGEVRPYLCKCQAGYSIGGITASGNIAACPELSDAFVQGHIDEDSFRHVWDTRYQIFRDRSWMKVGVCAECDSYDRCHGGAIHLYDRPGEEISRCVHVMLGSDSG